MSHHRKRLTSAQREALWNSEAAKTNAAGRGVHPLCNLCGAPVFPGQKWHVSHIGAPAALGGTTIGIAHGPCNLRDNHENVTPMVAKAKRTYRKHIGAHVSARPMDGSRDSRFKKRMDGTVERRR